MTGEFNLFSTKRKIMSSSNSPCAACKCLRRKCSQGCVFAPFFPPDKPQKFINVHKVFGASNVAKLLNELTATQREDAVNSLAYEAEYRLQDPVYGCVGLISILQHKLKQVQHDLNIAKKELAAHIGPTALLPFFQHPGVMQQYHSSNPSVSAAAVMPYHMQPMMGMPTGVAPTHGGPLMIRELEQQQMYEAQQFAAAIVDREQQQHEIYRTYEHQQPQQQQPQPQPPQELMKYSNGFDGVGQVTSTAYNTINAAAMSPSLALDSYEGVPYHQMPPQQQQQPPPEHTQSHQHHYHQFQLQSQKMLQQQQPPPPPPQSQQIQLPLQSQTSQQQPPQKAKSEEGRSVCPSC